MENLQEKIENEILDALISKGVIIRILEKKKIKQGSLRLQESKAVYSYSEPLLDPNYAGNFIDNMVFDISYLKKLITSSCSSKSKKGKAVVRGTNTKMQIGYNINNNSSINEEWSIENTAFIYLDLKNPAPVFKICY